MKKFLVKSLVIALSLLVFFGCKREPGEKIGKKQHFDNVDALIIINPTSQTKGINDEWVYLDTSRDRSIDDINDFELFEESEEEFSNIPAFTYVEHTVPCVDNTENLILKSNREVEPARIIMGFEKNEWKSFLDPYCNNSKHCIMSYEGEHCYVWVDKNAEEDSKLSDEQIKTFAEKFDVIYEKETALCGPKYAGETAIKNIIGPCEKVSLVLFDIGSDKNRGNVYGYFTSSDFQENVSYGNSIEAIYVDSYYAKQEDITSELHSTVAHEFNHMLNYVNKTLKYGLSFDTWFTEMLSMLAQDFFMDDQQVPVNNSVWGRLGDVFFKKSYNFGFGNWRNLSNEGTITMYNYANAFTFGAFLARNYGGAQLVHEMATNEYYGKKAVTEAVNKLNGTNYTFEDLLEQSTLVFLNQENQNEKLPSLAKGTEDKLEGYDFVYTLKPIIPSELFEIFDLPSDSKFIANSVDKATDNSFDSLGFQFYEFSKPTDVDVYCKDFLKIKVYRK